MTLALFHAPPSGVGAMTSGGTESILMAVRAYREAARSTRGVTEPELIVPSTVHAAFDKAADYFRVRLVKVAVDPTTFRADVAAMLRAVNRNTIALVCSAPCYPNGVIDPVAELAAGAAARGLPLHVDCCLGSFLIASAGAAGATVPPFDFAVPVRARSSGGRGNAAGTQRGRGVCGGEDDDCWGGLVKGARCWPFLWPYVMFKVRRCAMVMHGDLLAW